MYETLFFQKVFENELKGHFQPLCSPGLIYFSFSNLIMTAFWVPMGKKSEKIKALTYVLYKLLKMTLLYLDQ
jgi:hypothetical protein